MEKALKLLPLGTSDFENLRHRDQIYVDKTDMICELASVPGKFFFARPRRFGKSLLLSTFESLFRDGLKNFQGLKIEQLWTDKSTYKSELLGVAYTQIRNPDSNLSLLGRS